jgi:hypothetical protein
MQAPKRIAGLQIRLYSNDHDPEHIHIIKPGDWEIRVYFLLSGTNCLTYDLLWNNKNKRPSSKDMKRIATYIKDYKNELINEWINKHGSD